MNPQQIQQMNNTTGVLPVNQQSTSTIPKMVVSSKPAKKEFMNYSMNLSKMLASLQNTNVPGQKPEPTLENTQNDPYMKLLNKQSLLDDEASKSLMATISASRYRNEASTRDTYDRYKRGLALLGVQTGEAQFTPEMLQGKLQQAETQKIAKLNEYEIEANKALIDAKRAQLEGNLSILREKMSYIKQLKDERDNYLKDLASNLKAETEIADNRAEAIYNSLQTLSGNEKELFLNEVADRYGIPVTSLVSAVSRIAEGKVKKGGSGGGREKKLTLSQIETLRKRYPDIDFTFGMTEQDASDLIDQGVFVGGVTYDPTFEDFLSEAEKREGRTFNEDEQQQLRELFDEELNMYYKATKGKKSTKKKTTTNQTTTNTTTNKNGTREAF